MNRFIPSAKGDIVGYGCNKPVARIHRSSVGSSSCFNSVTVILPTYNEEAAVGLTIDSIPTGWCEELEILIVDGQSKDKTREIALEKGARVHVEPRKGYGRAYRTGFAIAKGDYIVTMDADCTYLSLIHI